MPFVFLLVLIFVYCGGQSWDERAITYTVGKDDFVSRISENGVFESEKSVTIACPTVWPAPKIKWLIPEGTILKKGDTVCILDASQIQINYENALKELETTKAQYNRTRADLNLKTLILESQIKSIDASSAISELQALNLEFVSPLRKKIIQLELKKSEIEKNKLLQKMSLLKVINESELKKMEMKIVQSENKVNRSKMSLDKLTITSSIDGIAVYANHWRDREKIKEGDDVWANMPLIKIPDVNNLQVKLNVSERSVKRIKEEQEVFVRADAYPDLRIPGKVKSVAKMGKVINKKSKVKTFEVVISIDEQDKRLQSGLSAGCDIMIETADSSLSVPLECVFEKDSSKVVYVRNGSKFVMRAVELGVTSENYAVVKEGLTVGEILAMIEPPEKYIKER